MCAAFPIPLWRRVEDDVMDNRRFMKCALWTLTAVLTSVGAKAEERPTGDAPQWFTEPYAYVLVEQDVRAALEEFGHNLGLIVVMSDKVRGKSRSRVRGESAGEIGRASL